MGEAVTADLVAIGGEEVQLAGGEITRRADEAADDVPGGVQVIFDEDGAGGKIIRITIVEGKTDTGIAVIRGY